MRNITYLNSFSTIFSGSACSMASSKNSSKVGIYSLGIKKITSEDHVCSYLQLLQNIGSIPCVVQNGYIFLLLQEVLVFSNLPGPF